MIFRSRASTLAVALAVLGFAAAPAAANATGLYVATSGNDSSNDCQTSASPCQTIAHALTQATPSSTIEVAAGEYREGLAIDHANEAGVHILGSGSAPDGTVIAAGSVLIRDEEPGVELGDLRLEESGNNESAILAGGKAIVTEGVAIHMSNASSGARAAIVANGSSLIDTTIDGNWTGSALQGIGSVTLEGDTFTSSSASTQGLVILEKGADPEPTFDIIDTVIDQTNTVLPPEYNVEARDGNLLVDSSLLIGGRGDLFISDYETQLASIVSSTLDAGEPGAGVNDAGSRAVVLKTTGSAAEEVSLIGSITLEGQAATSEFGGPASIACTDSDAPSQTQSASGEEGTIECASGSEGNTSTPVGEMLADGSGDFSLPPNDYTPKVGWDGVDSVPAEALPENLTVSSVDVLGNPRVANGVASCTAGSRDRGAIELQNRGAAPAPEISGATKAVVGEEVTFTASAPPPPGNPTVTYQWGASDSSSGSGQSFKHTFNTAGEYTVTLTATGAASCVGTTKATIDVNLAPAITSSNKATLTTGQAGSFEVTTTGRPDAALSESGALPTGVQFVDGGHGTATVSGTPGTGTQGVYNIEITAQNGVGTPAKQTFTLTVDAAPAITSADEVTFTTGQAGSFQVETTGLPTAAITETGTLPNGVSLKDNDNGTATLSGTPALGTQGVYNVEVSADNGVGTAAKQTFTLTVDASPTVTSTPATTFVTGEAGSFEVTATGLPDAGLSESGALPAGVQFVENGDGTATLSGTPAVETQGVYEIEITAENGIGTPAKQAFTLTVNAASTITSTAATTFVTGHAGHFQVTTTARPTATLTETGALPAGVSFTDEGDGTATLSGTPAADAQGAYQFTITATNGVGAAAKQTFTLTVDTPPTITSAASTIFTTGQAGRFQVTTSGLPISTIAEAGALPAGVSFTDDGDGTATLSGTPATGAQGAYSITFTATNNVGAPASQSFALTVGTPPEPVVAVKTLPIKPSPAAITKLTLSPSAFFPAPSRLGPFGTTISYVDSQAATTKFVVVRVEPGYRRGEKCVVPRAKHRHGTPCRRLVTVATFRHVDHAGTNSFRFHGCFSGCMVGHKLLEGLYRLRATPENVVGKGRTVTSTIFRALP